MRGSQSALAKSRIRRHPMKTKARPGNYSLTMVRCIAFIASAALISAGLPSARARHLRPQDDQQGGKIPPDQFDSLVAPVALHPDNLLSQSFAASTYPL